MKSFLCQKEIWVDFFPRIRTENNIVNGKFCLQLSQRLTFQNMLNAEVPLFAISKYCVRVFSNPRMFRLRLHSIPNESCRVQTLVLFFGKFRKNTVFCTLPEKYYLLTVFSIRIFRIHVPENDSILFSVSGQFIHETLRIYSLSSNNLLVVGSH